MLASKRIDVLGENFNGLAVGTTVWLGHRYTLYYCPELTTGVSGQVIGEKSAPVSFITGGYVTNSPNKHWWVAEESPILVGMKVFINPSAAPPAEAAEAWVWKTPQGNRDYLLFNPSWRTGHDGLGGFMGVPDAFSHSFWYVSPRAIKPAC